MLKLGVNVDHVATLREARYRGRNFGEPDPVDAALLCERAGAHGITVHLREDRRHIQDRDVWKLKQSIRTRLNLEMAASKEILAIALQLKPHSVCIVPERRLEITTEGGLNVRANLDVIKEFREQLNEAGITVSLFIDPEPHQIEASAFVGAQCVELHTGQYCENFNNIARREQELQKLETAARLAHEAGLQVNAGHGLNYINLPLLLQRVPFLEELNIGHSIISRAVFVGIETAVKEMLNLMAGYNPIKPGSTQP